MCGLIGIIDTSAPKGTHISKINKMMSSIKHRGPDGEGISEPVDGLILGHVRLAVLDLDSRANQPMQSFNRLNTIIYNGELYNHHQLRQILKSKGMQFHTTSDTEVILNAYEYWGEAAIEKLNGMFALAIYDHREQTLLLARDRLGIKPLYYTKTSNGIYFASEIKALLIGSNESPDICPNGLAEYMAFQNNYSNHTMMKDIFLFPAASLAKIKISKPTLEPKRYWYPEPYTKLENTKASSQQLNDLLSNILTDQCQADVPVSSFLSSGIDSSSIAYLASMREPNIKTFTCGFDVTDVTDSELLFDERKKARQMAEFIGSEHHEITLNGNHFLENLYQFAWHAEEPRIGCTFPNYSVSKLASKHTKVCLSGTGADELFGGYPWRYTAALCETDNSFIKTYESFWRRMVSKNDYQVLIEPIAASLEFDAESAFNDRMNNALDRCRFTDNRKANAMLLMEQETFLQSLLVAEDKASMAHGLEVRVPFTDNRLLDFSMNLSFSDKVDMNQHILTNSIYGKGSSNMPSFANGKKILREVLSQYVIKEISEGRKQGFSPPVETWFRREMTDFLNDEVFSLKSPLRNYLNMPFAQSLWKQHLNGQSNHRLFVWGMMAIHLFYSSFLRTN